MNLSILGIYQIDTTIFDSLVVPDAIDKEALIAEILSECSDFTLLYPDCYTMRYLLGKWSAEKSQIWNDLVTSTQFDYNPIENYNRYEEVTREVESESSDSSTGNSESSTDSTADNTNTRSKTAFNSSTFADTDKITDSGTSTTESESSSTASGTYNGSGSENVTSHMHGNIGVTTTTQMIREYRDVSMFSVIKVIVDQFKDKFCICVY